MGSLSPIHWILLLLVVLLLFGGGKISGLMGDFAKGIKAFKKGMKEEEDTTTTAAPKNIEGAPAPAAKEKDRASV